MEKTNDIKLKNFPYQIFIFAFVLLILPPFVHLFPRIMKKTFLSSITPYIHTMDILLISVAIIIFFSKGFKKRYFSNFSSICLLFFLVIARLSLAFSGGKDAYKACYELFKFAIITSCFFIFFSKYAKENKKGIIKIFFIAVLFIAFFQCIIAIAQYFLQHPVGLHFLGEPNFGIGIEGSAVIPVKGGSRWFFDTGGNLNHLVRAHGTFIHPNILGGFLIMTSMMTYYTYYLTKIRWQKVLFSLFIFLQMFSIVLTFSRAAIGVCIISYAIFFSLMFVNKYKVGITSLLIVGLSVISCFILLHHQIQQRGGLINYNEANKHSDKDRWILQHVAIDMIKQKPLLGVGFKNFILKRNNFSIKNAPGAQVHNVYFLIASEIGLLGLLCFMGFLVSIMIKAYRAKLHPLSIVFVSTILGFLAIGLVDHYFVTAQFGRLLFFISCGMLYFVSNKELSYSQKVLLYRE